LDRTLARGFGCHKVQRSAATAGALPKLPACPRPAPTRFRVYFNRLVSPFVSEKQRPPPLQLRGHYRLWSWLIPVFKLPDGELLESAGLDALVRTRSLQPAAYDAADGSLGHSAGDPNLDRVLACACAPPPLRPTNSPPPAQVAQRILGFGCLALLPLSVLAVAV
jgi:hypothetical protein